MKPTMIFKKIHKGNARAFFNLYMERKEASLIEFKARSEQQGGPPISQLDYSSASLVPLWLWIRDQMPQALEHPPSDQLPPWYDFEVRNNPQHGVMFTPQAAANIDGLAYYWGETLIHNIPDLKWDIGAYPKSLGFCCPLIQGEFFGTYPLHNAVSLGIFSGIKDNARNTYDTLAQILERERKSAESYKADFIKTGKHSDPRPPRRVKFE